MNGISLFSFDFSGHGKSGGNLCTLGLREAEDVEAAVNYLASRANYAQIVLWGKSMGAVAALIYQSQTGSESVKALVLDSAFASFK